MRDKRELNSEDYILFMKPELTFFTVENIHLVEYFPAGKIVVKNFNVLLKSWFENDILFVSTENQKKLIPTFLNDFYDFLFKLLNFKFAADIKSISKSINSNTSTLNDKKFILSIKKSTKKFYKDYPHLKNNFQLDILSSLYFRKFELEVLLSFTKISTKEKNRNRARLSADSESLKLYKKILKLNSEGYSIYKACKKLTEDSKEHSQNLEARFWKWAKTNNVQVIKHKSVKH